MGLNALRAAYNKKQERDEIQLESRHTLPLCTIQSCLPVNYEKRPTGKETPTQPIYVCSLIHPPFFPYPDPPYLSHPTALLDPLLPKVKGQIC